MSKEVVIAVSGLSRRAQRSPGANDQVVAEHGSGMLAAGHRRRLPDIGPERGAAPTLPVPPGRRDSPRNICT